MYILLTVKRISQAENVPISDLSVVTKIDEWTNIRSTGDFGANQTIFGALDHRTFSGQIFEGMDRKWEAWVSS